MFKISFRDYMMAGTLHAIINRQYDVEKHFNDDVAHTGIAVAAYRAADAMLELRRKKFIYFKEEEVTIEAPSLEDYLARVVMQALLEKDYKIKEHNNAIAMLGFAAEAYALVSTIIQYRNEHK